MQQLSYPLIFYIAISMLYGFVDKMLEDGRCIILMPITHGPPRISMGFGRHVTTNESPKVHQNTHGGY
ncbi:MAG: hypothetical protein QOJ54_1218 [Aliidongia sp.]|nr:hypothetical protein [Aliidongia sp.]